MIFMVLFGWSILMMLTVWIALDVMAVYHALLITEPGQFTRICEASARYARKHWEGLWEYSWLEVSRDSH